MTPYACTQNSVFHIDYGVPLLASKSTDYRTSSRKNHDFIPSLPQDFDCRVKVELKPELKETDIALRNEYKSTYNADFLGCHNVDNAVMDDRAMGCKQTDYLRTTGEKIFRESVSHNSTNISEMKGAFIFHNGRLPRENPPLNFTCEIPECYTALQPDVNPADSGFFKYQDIYLSGNRSDYPLHTKQQFTRAREHIFTIYDQHSGTHKESKDELPCKLDGNKTIGNSSECHSEYVNPARLVFYPYRQENGVYCPESFAAAGPWQNLSAAAMYCSENCHIGSRWPIRSVVDLNHPSQANKIIHSNSCCSRN
ncbi:hypothetical protein HUJ05_007470 [Dendroctonus ponderosae]|nr:hypothetical protein HUJ05_007470 [Dendroctonus ponderosae]